MKRIVCVLLCAAACLGLLSGCMGTLSQAGTYHYQRPHVTRDEEMLEQLDTIDNADDLREAVFGIIRAGIESDVLLVGDYPGDLDADLDAVAREATESYPFGVYVVSSILYKPVSVLSYTEVTVTVQYKRTETEMSSITPVTDISDFARRMEYFFSAFNQDKAFEMDGFYDSDELFLQRLERAWLQEAHNAIDLESLSYTFYPDDQAARIIVIEAEYLSSTVQLKQKSQEITDQAALLVEPLSFDSDAARAAWIVSYLQQVSYDSEAMHAVLETDGKQPKTATYTAYGALMEGRAAQSGLALAAQVLAEQMGLNSQMVAGRYQGVLHYWLYVNLDGTWWHFDPTVAHVDGLLVQDRAAEPSETSAPTPPQGENVDITPYLFDGEQAAQRYLWNADLYPLG